jgi:hypothetical protein
MKGHDPIVVLAISNVTGGPPVGKWWGLSSHEQTQAIYDEIKRLDRIGVNQAVAPLKARTRKPQHGVMTGR